MNDVSSGAHLDACEARQWINSYVPVDSVSAEYQRQFVGLIDRAPDYFANRHNYELQLPGHFTAQAVVFNPDLQAVALMHHLKLGIWVGPGGHIDVGDANAEMAARREAEEEMGLTDLVLMRAAPFDLDVHGFPAKGTQPDHLHYDIRYLFSTSRWNYGRTTRAGRSNGLPLPATRRGWGGGCPILGSSEACRRSLADATTAHPF